MLPVHLIQYSEWVNPPMDYLFAELGERVP